MAKCCGNSCNCTLHTDVDVNGWHALLVTGSGTTQDPYQISFKGIVFNSNGTIDPTVVFDSTTGYSVSLDFGVNSRLGDIGNVLLESPSNGDVLAWDSSISKWKHQAPVTAPAGAVVGDASIAGDGSAGTPLSVAAAPSGGLEVDASNGLKLTNEVLSSVMLRYPDATTRDADTTTFALNQLSMLDNAPGAVDYWNGTDWLPLLLLQSVTGTELFQLSGAYTENTPVTLFVKQLSDTTDTDGSVTILSAADLDGFAGVLSVHVQPVLEDTYVTGSVAWQMSVNLSASTTEVVGVAFATDGSGEWVSQPVSGVVTAYLY